MDSDVAKWIHEVGMSPSELADELGLPRGQVSRLIVGKEEPDRLTKWALVGLRVARLQERRPRSLKTAKHTPTKPLAEELSDDTWTGKTARLALPILVERVNDESGRRLAYTELHEKVVGRGGQANVGSMTKYAFPLGRIANAMKRLGVPPITSIVVSRATGLPASGIDPFVVDYLRLDHDSAAALKTDSEFRREVFARLWNEVFDYDKWSAVMDQLGVTGDPEYDA